MEPVVLDFAAHELVPVLQLLRFLPIIYMAFSGVREKFNCVHNPRMRPPLYAYIMTMIMF